MSSEQSSVNAESVEQTKQQIRGLVSEIAALAKSEITPEAFYEAFLQRVVTALAAAGGAIWVLGENRRLELMYQINLSETLLDEESHETHRHLQLLDRVVRSGEPELVPPLAGSGDDEAGGNPTRFLLVVAPLISDKKIEGIVEVFQRPNAQPSTQRGYLRFVLQMCELAAEWLKSHKLREFSDRHSLWARADEFARIVHESLDLRDTCFTSVNEARRLIGCDRVAVAIKKGPSCKVEAVSGQDTLENRANIVTALNKLATRVIATGETLWFEGDTEDLPPQVEDALEEYVEESYAKSIIVMPLRKPDRPRELAKDVRPGDLERDHQGEREVFGALMIEQIETNLPREILQPRVDLVYEHTTRALANSLDYNRIFLMPVWRTIGKTRWLVEARNLPKTVMVAIVILLVLIGLFAVQKDFNIKARGVMQAINRQDVFFGTEGIVTKIAVKDGDQVSKGDLLITLSNPELEQRWHQVIGELEETRERLNNVYDQLQKGRRNGWESPVEEAQVEGQLEQLVVRERSLIEQLKWLNIERDQLQIKSPIKGTVMLAWDAEQMLLHRPVAATQKAMMIADPNGGWELELNVVERRIGHVLSAQRVRQKEKQGPLVVSYVLATDPSTKRQGEIRTIHEITQVTGEDGPTVQIHVDLKSELPIEPRAGATVIAQIKCGRSSVAYAWFHEAVEWVQKNILF